MRPHPVLDQLGPHAARLIHNPIAHVLAADHERCSGFSLRVGPIYANFARQKYDRAALDALFAVAEQIDLKQALQRLANGSTCRNSGRRCTPRCVRTSASHR